MIEGSDMEPEWFVDGNKWPLDIFCFLSITVRAPAVIYVKQFVWITPVLAVSCLFVLPEDVLSILHLC